MAFRKVPFVLAVAGVCAASTVAHAAPSPTQFTISVPAKPHTGTQMPITHITVRVNTETSGPVNFTVTDPLGNSTVTTPIGGATNFNGLNTGTAPRTGLFPQVGTDTSERDQLTITSPTSAASEIGTATAPAQRQFLFDFVLQTDFNPPGPSNDCDAQITAAETWTIQSSVEMTGVCVLSFDRISAAGSCQTTDGDITTGAAATVGGETSGDSSQICAGVRPPVDVMLVLDRSGSMAGNHLGSSSNSGRPKIDVLHDAVVDFSQVWNALRATEGATPPADRFGVVFFDTDSRSLADFGVSGWSASLDGLQTFATMHGALTNAASPHEVESVTPGGATSLGDGLLTAQTALFGSQPSKRKAIVVMSDGMENSDQRVRVVGQTTIETYATGSTTFTPLPNQAGVDIYAITVGASTAVSPEINEDLAIATGGTYVNTEDDGEYLRRYFLEILQNFLQFNTYQPLRLVRGAVDGKTPLEVELEVSDSTRTLHASVLWRGRVPGPDGEMGPGRPLRLIATPPDGSNARVGQGVGAIHLPLDPPVPGTWTLAVHPMEGIGAEFDLIVIGDDLGTKAKLSAVKGDYEPGDTILLQAQVVSGGLPVAGIGSQAGDSLAVEVYRPGQPIGEIVSSSGKNNGQPYAPDPTTTADAILTNALASDPRALGRTQTTVTLADDGKNGDATAGDGIYTGGYVADEPGHYNFLYRIAGSAQVGGRFSREQLVTVHVRAVPDPAASQPVITIADGVMNVVFTPKTKSGSRMGPGWANYFLVDVGGKRTALVDQLDGTYTLSAPFSGGTPPKLDISFVRTSMSITEADVKAGTIDQLPRDPVFGGDGGGKCKDGKGCCCPSTKPPGAPETAMLGVLLLWGIRRRRRRP